MSEQKLPIEKRRCKHGNFVVTRRIVLTKKEYHIRVCKTCSQYPIFEGEDIVQTESQ